MNSDKRIDWSTVLQKYGVPTVLKEKLILPYLAQQEFQEPILDVGCGTGYFSQLLVNRGYDVVGLDVNGELEDSEKFRFIKSDFIDFKSEQKFATILMINVLSCLAYDERLGILKKLKEIKADGGVAYVLNTNPELFGHELESEYLSIKVLGDKFIHVKVKLVNGEYIEFDDSIVSDNEMRKMCDVAGLEVMEKVDLKSKYLDKAVYCLYVLR